MISNTLAGLSIVGNSGGNSPTPTPGQLTPVVFVNDDSDDMPYGTLVYPSGDGLAKIARNDGTADEALAQYIVTEPGGIPVGESGDCSVGRVEGLTITGGANGLRIYLDEDGGLTTVEPTAEMHYIVPVGWCEDATIANIVPVLPGTLIPHVPLPPAGFPWTSRTTPNSVQFTGIAYGNGVFVCVANSGGAAARVMYSPDGINWTAATAADASNWEAVAFGNGVFCAVASSPAGTKYVMTSPDGITWALQTQAAANSWQGICFGAGLFVAVSSTGTGNRVMTSPDGVAWTSRVSVDSTWSHIAYNGTNLFVAVAEGGTNRVMTSPDGITWTGRTAAAAIPWQGVAYGNGMWVACGTAGNIGNEFMSSPDGITWTSRAAPSDQSWHAVCYGENADGGLFVAVNGTDPDNAVATSPDGITWTGKATVTTGDFRSVTYAEDLFVAVSIAGAAAAVMTAP